jgi:hypothetical protein
MNRKSQSRSVTKPEALFQPEGRGTILDKATIAHTSFWVPKEMQNKLTLNLLRNEMEVSLLKKAAQFDKMVGIAVSV